MVILTGKGADERTARIADATSGRLAPCTCVCVPVSLSARMERDSESDVCVEGREYEGDNEEERMHS